MVIYHAFHLGASISKVNSWPASTRNIDVLMLISVRDICAADASGRFIGGDTPLPSFRKSKEASWAMQRRFRTSFHYTKGEWGWKLERSVNVKANSNATILLRYRFKFFRLASSIRLHFLLSFFRRETGIYVDDSSQLLLLIFGDWIILLSRCRVQTFRVLTQGHWQNPGVEQEMVYDVITAHCPFFRATCGPSSIFGGLL